MDVRARDPEARVLRAQAVGKRHEPRCPAACDDDRVHLGAFDEALEHRFLRAGLREGSMEVRFEVAGLVDAEEPPLSFRVSRFEHRGQADSVDRCAPLGEVAHRGEPRLRQPLLGEGAAHRELVREAVGGGRPE